MNIVLTVIQIILAIVLIASVLLQPGKQAGLSGSIAGGAETFFGKNKSRKIEGILPRITTIVAILFIILSFVLALLMK